MPEQHAIQHAVHTTDDTRGSSSRSSNSIWSLISAAMFDAQVEAKKPTQPKIDEPSNGKQSKPEQQKPDRSQQDGCGSSHQEQGGVRLRYAVLRESDFPGAFGSGSNLQSAAYRITNGRVPLQCGDSAPQPYYNNQPGLQSATYIIRR